jgi:hypothetical protein
MPLKDNVYAGSRGCIICGRSISWVFSRSRLKTPKDNGSVCDYANNRESGIEPVNTSAFIRTNPKEEDSEDERVQDTTVRLMDKTSTERRIQVSEFA